MKRYLLFGFLDYYPSGGWGDFVAASNDLEELKNRAKKGEKIVSKTIEYYKYDNYEIVDLTKLETVWSD